MSDALATEKADAIAQLEAMIARAKQVIEAAKASKDKDAQAVIANRTARISQLEAQISKLKTP